MGNFDTFLVLVDHEEGFNGEAISSDNTLHTFETKYLEYGYRLNSDFFFFEMPYPILGIGNEHALLYSYSAYSFSNREHM